MRQKEHSCVSFPVLDKSRFSTIRFLVKTKGYCAVVAVNYELFSCTTVFLLSSRPDTLTHRIMKDTGQHFSPIGGEHFPPGLSKGASPVAGIQLVTLVLTVRCTSLKNIPQGCVSTSAYPVGSCSSRWHVPSKVPTVCRPLTGIPFRYAHTVFPSPIQDMSLRWHPGRTSFHTPQFFGR